MPQLLLGLCFAWAFPFLISEHTLPIATFYGEWGAALLFFAVTALLLAMTWLQEQKHTSEVIIRPSWQVPQSVLLPLGFAIALGLQQGLGIGEQQWVQRIALLYAFAGIVVVVVASTLKQTIGTAYLIRTLAWTTLGVALIASGIEIIQTFQLEPKFQGLISQAGTGAPRRMYGNLNQPNHEATLVSMGLAALLWLVLEGVSRCNFDAGAEKLNGVRLHLFNQKAENNLGGNGQIKWSLTPFNFGQKPQVILITLYSFCVPLLLIGMALTGSRTAWAHLGLTVIMGLLMVWINRSKTTRLTPQLITVLVLPLLFTLLQPLLTLASDAWHLGLFNTVDKFKEGAAQTGARMALWKHAWTMFVEHPLLGVGWGDFTWQQFLLLDRLGVVVEMANNGHNIVLDLLAKIGAVGTALVALPLFAWVWRMFGVLKQAHPQSATSGSADDSTEAASLAVTANKLNVLLPVTWVAMLLFHSLLEFPLHYMYFWLVFCFLLGASDSTAYAMPTKLNAVTKGFAAVMSACFVVACSFLFLATWVDYRKAEALYYGDAIKSYESAPSLWWFSDFAQFGYAGTLALGEPMKKEEIQKRSAMMERAIHFNMLPSQVYRSALYRAMLGKPEEAYALLRPMHWYYTYLPGNIHAKGMVDLCEQVDESQRPQAFCNAMTAWQKGKDLPASPHKK